MRLIPSDPDVETIISRIQSGDIDLQPEFQRGEVWSKPKKQRLIDSILRDWHVPPIHVIESPESKKHEVLDGQQRLAAIRDFVDGHFPVDGNTEPLDNVIQTLDGVFYNDLPKAWKRQFNQFTIRLFRIVDYRGSEPGELFFRLNQPSSLTGAEQRNAFFGPVRQQIKHLVELLLENGLDKAFLGFSNSRMAYDDVLSRTALAIERRSLAEKITAADLAGLYRSDEPLKADTMALLTHGTDVLAECRRYISYSPKFNKATLFSWLIFIVRARLASFSGLNANDFARFLASFDQLRGNIHRDPINVQHRMPNRAPAGFLISIYENRSSSRVADVSSVILRDAILWLFFEDHTDASQRSGWLSALGLNRVHESMTTDNLLHGDDSVARRLIENGWGKLG